MWSLPHNFQGSSSNTTAPDRTRGRNGKIKFSFTSKFLKIKEKIHFRHCLLSTDNFTIKNFVQCFNKVQSYKMTQDNHPICWFSTILNTIPHQYLKWTCYNKKVCQQSPIKWQLSSSGVRQLFKDRINYLCWKEFMDGTNKAVPTQLSIPQTISLQVTQ